MKNQVCFLEITNCCKISSSEIMQIFREESHLFQSLFDQVKGQKNEFFSSSLNLRPVGVLCLV
ncbi:hypothetical protein AB834_01005 [PVC group bacterium (ex Bugula neritina AB1)]|nr:hypothetical protein AB834_01005 [PVC group bacterium (ex Bugula neritina AB1)]